jgi:hypothetical protein
MNRLIVIVFLLPLFACVYHDLPVDCSRTTLSLQVDTVVSSATCDAADGRIHVLAEGGKAPYLFSMGENAWQTSSDFSGLSSGFYTVFVKDLYGCRASVDSILVSVDQFDAEVISTTDDDCLGGTGTLEVEVFESNAPYHFKLDDGEFTSVNFFQDLQEGEHFLTIKDADGCMVTLPAPISHGPTGISWQNDILPIMVESCATSGCHDGITRLDWRDYNNVKQYAASIKENTQNRSMPFDGTLPQDEIDKIACW